MSAAEKLRAKIAPKVSAGGTAEVIQHPATVEKTTGTGKIEVPGILLEEVNAVVSQEVENDVASMVKRFNAEHFVSVDGGVTSVYREAFDHELNRHRLDRLGLAAFKALHSNKFVAITDSKGNSTTKPVAVVWLNHPARRTFHEGIALLPAGDLPVGVYNLWRGFGCEPKAGVVVADVKVALVHIFRVICSSDRRAFDYAVAWLAYAVQHPERQAEVAIVLQGGRGSGKGTLGRWFRDLFGMHGMHIQHPRHLTGNFNAHLQTCLAMFVDEAFFVGDRAGNGVLKSLITEDQMTIEKKGIDVTSVRNRLKIIMATNEDHAILAGDDERRYFVLRVSDVKKGDHDYFGKLNAWWDSGGKEAFLGYLLEYDLAGFNIRKVPNTEALEQQKLYSLAPLDAWLLERLHDADRWTSEQPRDQVAGSFAEYVKQHGHRFVKTSTDAVGQGLRKHLDIGEKRESTGRRRRMWVFPALMDARQQFAASLGLEFSAWIDESEGGDGL
jgi:hypothetical protein